MNRSARKKSFEQVLTLIKEHHALCIFKPMVSAHPVSSQCDLCEFKSTDECILKRHRRDMHDFTTKSTSPKPKRRKSLELIMRKLWKLEIVLKQ